MNRRMALLAVLSLLLVVSVAGCTTLMGPKLPTTDYDRAMRMQEAKKYQDAIKLYQQFIAKNEYPNLNGYAQYNIARCYELMGERAKAIAEYNALVEKYPQHKAAEWAKANVQALEAKPVAPPAPPKEAAKPAAPKKAAEPAKPAQKKK